MWVAVPDWQESWWPVDLPWLPPGWCEPHSVQSGKMYHKTPTLFHNGIINIIIITVWTQFPFIVLQINKFSVTIMTLKPTWPDWGMLLLMTIFWGLERMLRTGPLLLTWWVTILKENNSVYLSNLITTNLVINKTPWNCFAFQLQYSHPSFLREGWRCGNLTNNWPGAERWVGQGQFWWETWWPEKLEPTYWDSSWGILHPRWLAAQQSEGRHYR